VQEHVVPPLVPPTTEGSLADLPARNAANNPGRVAFTRKEGGRWVEVTAREFNDDVRAVAKGLVAAGIAPGDRVAIMSKTRYEWTLFDFAIWTAGAVGVPIYETSSAEQVAWILSDSGASAVVLETAAHQAVVDEVRPDLPGLKQVWQLDSGAVATLTEAGAGVSDEQLAAATAGVNRASIATIIYTSGTTGRPKGVQLTHDNFMALSDNAMAKLWEVVKAEGARPCSSCPWHTCSRASSRCCA
jgi:long-chain acyl-CoA synthetase